jgi:hypothetical protein
VAWLVETNLLYQIKHTVCGPGTAAKRLTIRGITCFSKFSLLNGPAAIRGTLGLDRGADRGEDKGPSRLSCLTRVTTLQHKISDLTNCSANLSSEGGHEDRSHVEGVL